MHVNIVIVMVLYINWYPIPALSTIYICGSLLAYVSSCKYISYMNRMGIRWEYITNGFQFQDEPAMFRPLTEPQSLTGLGKYIAITGKQTLEIYMEACLVTVSVYIQACLTRLEGWHEKHCLVDSYLSAN